MMLAEGRYSVAGLRSQLNFPLNIRELQKAL